MENSNENVTFAPLKFYDMRTSEFKKLLRKNGCYLLTQGGRHEKWYSPITGNKFAVPRHDGQEIPTGTLQAIKKQAGI